MFTFVTSGLNQELGSV